MNSSIARAALRLAIATLLSSSFACAHGSQPDLATETFPDAQHEVKDRLAQIWDAAGKGDLDRLRSYHLYGPKFTEFKDGGPRGDAASGEAGERAFFTAATDVGVEMKDLAVNVFGDVAIATFNGRYTAKMQGAPIAVQMETTMVLVNHAGEWKIVHEHMSPLGAPPPG